MEKDREIDCVLLNDDGWNLSVFLERSLREDERKDMLYVRVVGGGGCESGEREVDEGGEEGRSTLVL